MAETSKTSEALRRAYQEDIADDPYAATVGPPLKYPQDVIEQALFTAATQASNCNRASRILASQGIEVPPGTIRDWIRGRFRNRYQEICSNSASQLQEQIARGAIDLSIELQAAEKAALDQTLAGLANANGREASDILRNLSTSKKIQLDSEGALRGRANVVVDVRGFAEIGRALQQLGIADFVEGDAEDISTGELEAGEPDDSE